jgi:hypothetical protein
VIKVEEVVYHIEDVRRGNIGAELDLLNGQLCIMLCCLTNALCVPICYTQKFKCDSGVASCCYEYCMINL